MTAALLNVHKLDLDTPGGRPLFRDLTLSLERGDKVALVGRNGVGKSTLLRVLAGETAAVRGEVACSGERRLVPQGLELAPAESPGEQRRRRLQAALDDEPDLLLLDEPTHDLDRDGSAWIARALQRWPRALVVVSHDRRLLRDFRDFFLVSESGCRHFHGSCDELVATLAQEQEDHERRYLSQLAQLLRDEQHRDKVERRLERKKNAGRIRQIDRNQSRMLLNAKRSAGQVNRAKRRAILDNRVETARGWVHAARRTLAIDLPLPAALPQLPDALAEPIVQLERAGANSGERVLFQDLSLELRRERLAITGPNGAGKSTLIELVAGARTPQRGRVRCDPGRTGYVAQNSSNWQRDESLVWLLTGELGLGADAAASCMRAHRFPFALAERPLVSLSPGERLRAALICMLQRQAPPELLILDEPTSHLDFLGYDALQTLLSAWPGGIVIASHDQAFLDALRLDQTLSLI